MVGGFILAEVYFDFTKSPDFRGSNLYHRDGLLPLFRKETWMKKTFLFPDRTAARSDFHVLHQSLD